MSSDLNHTACAVGYSLSPLRGWKEANVARGYMQRLHEEVRQRFPEIARLTASDDESPYLVVGYIADWLLTVAKPELDPDVIRRIVEEGPLRDVPDQRRDVLPRFGRKPLGKRRRPA